MVHPLVEQLRFTRSEWQRALDGLSDEDARRRLAPMNCISWMIGHLAWHEQACWLTRAQGRVVAPELNELVANGKPACEPPLAEMWDAWRAIAEASDPYLDALTTDTLLDRWVVAGRPHGQTIGTALRRVTYHYWFHTGEALAVRQILGHPNLPEFVGDIHIQAPYRPEGE